MGSRKHSSNRLYLTSRRQQSPCGHGHRSQGRVRSIQKRASVEGQGCLLTLHWRNGPSCPESAPTHRPHFSHLNVGPENSQGYDKYVQRALWLCVIHSTERFSLAAEAASGVIPLHGGASAHRTEAALERLIPVPSEEQADLKRKCLKNSL